jgi:large subunit ribosomal protein L25
MAIHGPSEGEKNGGILVEQTSTVSVRCLPADIPTEIAVDVRPLNVHDSLHVKDLQMPEGVEAADDLEKVIVSIVEPRFGVAQAATEEGEEGGTEPAVIGKEGAGESEAPSS